MIAFSRECEQAVAQVAHHLLTWRVQDSSGNRKHPRSAAPFQDDVSLLKAGALAPFCSLFSLTNVNLLSRHGAQNKSALTGDTNAYLSRLTKPDSNGSFTCSSTGENQTRNGANDRPLQSCEQYIKNVIDACH